MFKLFIFIFITIFVSACGVDTASSQTEVPVVVIEDPTVEDEISSGYDLIDLNPISSVIDTPDDGNKTDPDDDNSTDTVDNNSSDVVSEFDMSGAIEDKFACILGENNDGYTNNAISDSSYDYAGESDEEDGVTINSGISYNDDPALSTVTLFYYDLKPVRAMDMVSVFEDGYTMYIDQAWALNDETVVYVRTPKNEDGLYGCYRYDTSGIDTGIVLARTKVYRVIIEE